MLKDIKKTGKHTSVYVVGNMATKVVGLILLPLYTNETYLSQDSFGALAILEATTQVLVSFFSFALGNSLVRWYWDNDYIAKQKNIVYTLFAFLAVVNIPLFAVFIHKSEFFATLLLRSSSYDYLFKITFLTIFFRIFNTLLSHLLQIQAKSVSYSVLNLSKLIVVLLLTILAVTKFGRGLEGIWEATLIGEVLSFFALLPYLFKNMKPKFEMLIFKEMFKYSYPLVIANLAVTALTVTDRYMLHYISGLAATGIYSLGLRVANTIKIVITDSVMSALSPLRMQKINDENNHRFFSKVATYTSFIFIIVLLCVSLFSLEAIKIITKTKEYWDAASIIGLLSFAYLFSLMRINFTSGLTITKKSNILGILTFATALLNLGLNFLFIPLWDIYGAALSTIISQIFYMLITYWYAQKSYFIPYEIKKMCVAILLAACVVFVGNQLDNVHVVLRLFVKASLLCVYPFILYLFNFYEKAELETIKDLYVKLKSPRKLKENLYRMLK